MLDQVAGAPLKSVLWFQGIVLWLCACEVEMCGHQVCVVVVVVISFIILKDSHYSMGLSYCRLSRLSRAFIHC